MKDQRNYQTFLTLEMFVLSNYSTLNKKAIVMRVELRIEIFL